MSNFTKCGNLSVDANLYAFVNEELLLGTAITPAAFCASVNAADASAPTTPGVICPPVTEAVGVTVALVCACAVVAPTVFIIIEGRFKSVYQGS